MNVESWYSTSITRRNYYGGRQYVSILKVYFCFFFFFFLSSLMVISYRNIYILMCRIFTIQEAQSMLCLTIPIVILIPYAENMIWTKRMYHALSTMRCFQWDILYRNSCLVMVMKHTLKEPIPILQFKHVSSLSSTCTCTNYPIGSNALWQVYHTFSYLNHPQCEC